jgi:hypothetical protein
MKFTLNRDKTISSTMGYSIAFVKGVATHVPPAMWAEVQAIGAVPDNELPEEKKADTREPQDPVARKAAIMAAFEQMILSAKREDFTGTGVPHAKALAVLIGFTIDGKERDALWQEYKVAAAEAAGAN